MQAFNNLLVFLAMAAVLSGCASLSRLEEAMFKDSTLNNLNPAPDSMSPPDQVKTDNPTIDPLYLRSQADYHYTLGEALSLEGDSERAIEAFKLTLVYDPESVIVRLRLSAEYVRQGLLSEAIEQAEMAVKNDSESVEGRLLLGGLYSSLKMYDLATDQYSEILRIDPENQEVPTYMGALLAEQKKYAEAEAHFKKLAKNKRNRSPYLAYYYIGRIREERGKDYFSSAEQAYLQSIGLKPGAEEPVIALSRLYSAQKLVDRELRLLRSYQDKFGPNRKVAHRLSQIYLEDEKYQKAYDQLEILEGFDPSNLNVKVRLSLILIEQKHYNRAIDKLEEILAVAPELDKIRFYLGGVYEEIKQYERAIKHFSRIPSSSAYFAEAVIHSAHLHKLAGNFDKAMSTMKQGIKIRDDVPQFYAYYASLLDDKREYDDAIQMLNKAVAKFPTHTQLRFFLGSMYDRKGKKEKTIEHMKKVLDLDENHVQALNYLAYTYAELDKNLPEAEQMAFRALQLNPDDGYILDTIGWILYKQDKVNDAIHYLEAAYKHKSSESIVAEHLGDAYYRSQLIDKAKQMYMKAVSIEKDQNKIKRLRTKIVSIEQQQASHKNKTRQPASKPSSSK